MTRSSPACPVKIAADRSENSCRNAMRYCAGSILFHSQPVGDDSDRLQLGLDRHRLLIITCTSARVAFVGLNLFLALALLKDLPGRGQAITILECRSEAPHLLDRDASPGCRAFASRLEQYVTVPAQATVIAVTATMAMGASASPALTACGHRRRRPMSPGAFVRHIRATRTAATTFDRDQRLHMPLAASQSALRSKACCTISTAPFPRQDDCARIVTYFLDARAPSRSNNPFA